MEERFYPHHLATWRPGSTVYELLRLPKERMERTRSHPVTRHAEEAYLAYCRNPGPQGVRYRRKRYEDPIDPDDPDSMRTCLTHGGVIQQEGAARKVLEHAKKELADTERLLTETDAAEELWQLETDRHMDMARGSRGIPSAVSIQRALIQKNMEILERELDISAGEDGDEEELSAAARVDATLKRDQVAVTASRNLLKLLDDHGKAVRKMRKSVVGRAQSSERMRRVQELTDGGVEIE